jgi:multisite-specific tRNA:(cytosine-C5)-methyltransferase
MLPKEDRRAMLLRIFNDDTPVVNTTQKRTLAAAQASTPAVEAVSTEEENLKQENIEIGQDEQEQMDTQENQEETV